MAAVVGDDVAGEFVAHLAVLEALPVGALDEAHRFDLAVVLDALGHAFDVLLDARARAVAALPETRELARRAGDDRVLVALGILAKFQARAGDAQRAAREHDAARVDDDLLEVVAELLVGVDLGRLVAVGALGRGRRDKREREAGRRRGAQQTAHFVPGGMMVRTLPAASSVRAMLSITIWLARVRPAPRSISTGRSVL